MPRPFAIGHESVAFGLDMGSGKGDEAMNENSYKFRAFADEQYPQCYGDQRPNGYGIVGDEQNELCVNEHYSSILDQSNHAVILADLQELDDRVTTVWLRSADWILIPLVPAVVERAAEWLDGLANYPVASDEDFSRREHEDLLETLTNCHDLSDDMAERVARKLFDDHSVCRSDDMHNEMVTKAKAAVHADLLDELGLDEDQRHDAAREMLADEYGQTSLVIADGGKELTGSAALQPIVTGLRDRGLRPEVATTDDDGRVVLVMDWNDARAIACA